MEFPDRDPSLPSLLSKLAKLFSFRNAATKKLLKFKHGEQNELKESDEAFLENLIKLLKKRKRSVEELLNALSHPDQPSKCVTIPRSDDVHAQVSDGRDKIHVTCCRLWRWSDLYSHHQISPITSCEFSFDANLKEICVNPYHYELKENFFLQPIQVPNQLEMTAVDCMQQHEQFSSDAVGYYGNMSPNSTVSSVDSSGLTRPNSISPCSSIPQTPLPPCTPSVEDVNQVYGETVQRTDGVQVCYEDFFNWARIAYYELNCRVGEIFQCNSNRIIVDGFTNPRNDADRFCLGQLTNVERNSSIEQTRQHIGKGLELVYTGGNVYAENRSNASIFLQSPNSNLYHSFDFNTVCKLPPSCSLCIFSNQYFARLLSQSVYLGFESVYDLTKMCTIRISFVKGWGAEYYRQDIMSTPCWMEMHLNGPLRWLDKVLTQMGSPQYAISSVS